MNEIIAPNVFFLNRMGASPHACLMFYTITLGPCPLVHTVTWVFAPCVFHLLHNCTGPLPRRVCACGCESHVCANNCGHDEVGLRVTMDVCKNQYHRFNKYNVACAFFSVQENVRFGILDYHSCIQFKILCCNRRSLHFNLQCKS